MCLILFAHNHHPDYPLIVAANRDEFYARPTAPAQFWEDHPQLLAGRDLQDGGTWLGITRQGRFAAITNYREGEASEPHFSRGKLTRDFLLGTQSAADYVQAVADQGAHYRGFNLLIGKPGDLYYCSNRTAQPEQLEPGIYALGNGTLHHNWHKMAQGRDDLGALLARTEPSLDALLELMRDRRISPDHQLPDTGIGLDRERLLSARFIRTEQYGTRATTLLMVDRTGEATVLEQTHTADGTTLPPRQFHIKTVD